MKSQERKRERRKYPIILLLVGVRYVIFACAWPMEKRRQTTRKGSERSWEKKKKKKSEEREKRVLPLHITHIDVARQAREKTK